MRKSRAAARLVTAAAMFWALAAGATLTGCNTIEGAGQDLQAIGHALGDATRSAKRKIEE